MTLETRKRLMAHYEKVGNKKALADLLKKRPTLLDPTGEIQAKKEMKNFPRMKHG